MATHLGDLIHALRREAGLSIGELARRSGVDKSIISRVERREQATLKGDNLARIAQTLGSTAEELLRRAQDEAESSELPQRKWPTLEEWLRRDRNLTELQRDAILRVYQSYVGR